MAQSVRAIINGTLCFGDDFGLCITQSSGVCTDSTSTSGTSKFLATLLYLCNLREGRKVCSWLLRIPRSRSPAGWCDTLPFYSTRRMSVVYDCKNCRGALSLSAAWFASTKQESYSCKSLRVPVLQGPCKILSKQKQISASKELLAGHAC